MNMLFALALAALRFQAPGPVLPPSCSPAFQATVLSVEEALQNQEFSKAAERLTLLPKKGIAIDWSDSKVPKEFRNEFRKAGEAALSMWKERLPDISFNWKAGSDIRISFEPVLALRPGTNFPAAHVGFFGADATQLRLDFVIGLKRGSPLRMSEETDVFDDVAYCVGSYLGIADGAYPTYTMGTTDLPRIQRTSVSGTESATARQNFKVIQELRLAVKNKTQLTPVKSDLFIDPTTIDGDPAIQGDHVEFHIQLSNRGDGPLSFSLFPDCGCTAVTEPGIVKPQSSRIVSVAVDTTNFTSNITKHVAVYTNDPANPVRIVTLNVKVKPRYRVIAPLGDTFVVPDGGLKYPLYLIPAKGTSLDPVSTSFTSFPGVKAAVSFTPWQGMLADPEMHEGPEQRKGFKFVVDLKGDLGPGRNPGTLQIYTSNSEFPNITLSMYAQKGIIAVPDDLFMGEVGKVPVTRRIMITRPGFPFKVLGVATNSPNLVATAVQVPGSNDFAIVIRYDGKGHSGELMAAVKIWTNDPKQPLLDVPIRANVQ